MSEMCRLDSHFPSLATAFRAAPLARQRSAAVVATAMGRSLELFSKARATAAPVCARSDDPDALHDAIYEASVAVEDATNIVTAVNCALG